MRHLLPTSGLSSLLGSLLGSPLALALAASLALIGGGVAGCDNGAGAGAGVGASCSRDTDCDSGLRCFNRTGAGAACMASCSASTRLCADGELCLESSGGGDNVCYLGGSNALGTACASSTDCELGGVCVNVGGALACYQACTTDDPDPPCAIGEICAATSTDTNFGFCRPDGM